MNIKDKASLYLIKIKMWKVKEGKGRPEKITPDVVKKLKQIFMYDGTVEEACLYAGISKVTYYAKIKKDVNFLNEMNQARLFPYITAKKTLIKSMESDNEAIAQKGAVEFLKRRDKRYADKVEGTMEVDANIDAEVNLKDKSMIELEDMRKKFLGFK